MSKYATDQKFGGQQASVGRVVLLAGKKHDGEGVCLRAGMIVAISSKDDRPYIHDIAAGTCDWKQPAWKFFEPASPTAETRLTEIEVVMPVGSWTWPPRV